MGNAPVTPSAHGHPNSPDLEAAVRLSVILLACSVAGILGGGALIGTAALGGCLIFCSLCTAGWALARDDGQAAPSVHAVPRTLHDILERARQAS